MTCFIHACNQFAASYCDDSELFCLQPSASTKKSRDGPCNIEQANCALSCVLGPSPRGRRYGLKTDEQLRHDHQVDKSLPGVLVIYQQIAFVHERYMDRQFRLRCCALDTFHDKWPQVMHHANFIKELSQPYYNHICSEILMLSSVPFALDMQHHHSCSVTLPLSCVPVLLQMHQDWRAIAGFQDTRGI